MSRINKDDQPDVETKLNTLAGQDTGWDYQFSPPPVVGCGDWSPQGWVEYIGDNWFRKDTK